MKKFVLGALAALGGVGLYKLHKEGKFPSLKIKGTVDSINHDAQTFQLRSALDRNILMDFCVSPLTKFMRLPTAEGNQNPARFDDMVEGQRLSVSFVKNKESGRMIAERIVLE